jgi:glucose-6-phosphate dehydrogenase assembly protein OpcA
MNIDLTDTNSGKINGAILDARRRSGTPASGMVLTLVIVTDEAGAHDSLKAASDAAREHPSRVIVSIARTGRQETRLDAELRVGGESGPGETVLLRMYGELSEHADSVVLPLLLPDAPVVVWWPANAPDRPSTDRLGRLGQRRVTDAASATDPMADLAKRAAGYAPGDTDLSWTRITTWRSLLAAALDHPFPAIESIEVGAEPNSASAELLALWLRHRLGVPVERVESEGPGITSVTLATSEGGIAVNRPDGRLAMLTRPGWPDRPIALHRRTLSELIAEELRRLDPDDIYGEMLELIA